jgi:hypothetical protein
MGNDNEFDAGTNRIVASNGQIRSYIMRTKTIATSLILSFALIGAAQAGTPRGDSDNTPFQGVYGQDDSSSASRAQVQAELQQAHANGQVAFGDTDNVPFQAQPDAQVSRAQVAHESGSRGSFAFGDSDNTPFQGV